MDAVTLPLLIFASETATNCGSCGRSFRSVRARSIHAGRWSRSCKPAPDEAERLLATRFWPKVDATGDCWLWTGSVRHGYGQIHFEETARPVHRVAWELLIGPAPEGLEPDHRCRVRNCVNPAHIEWVTHQENTRRGFGFGDDRNKTECDHGHPFDAANTYLWRGERHCRTCRRASDARRRTRERAAA